MIRILQISDIHFLSCEDEVDDYSQLRQKLLEDIDDLVETIGEIQLILVCGDVAGHGQKDEDDKAREFFKDLAEHSHCDIDKIFLVPGNHDVNWGSHSCSRELLRRELFDQRTNDNTLNTWRIDEPLAVMLAHAPFENYREMALIFDSNDELSQAIIDGEQDLSKRKMYWRKNIGKEGGCDVNLYGMNTAFISGKGDFSPEEGKGQKMFLPKCAFQITSTKNDINISMMHHPMTHVMRGDIIEKSLDNRFIIQLYGHTHKQSSDSNNVIKIFSGALQPGDTDGDEYVPIYNLMELHIDDAAEGKRLYVDLYSRQGDDAGFKPYKREKVTLSAPLKHVNQWEKTIQGTDSQQEEPLQSTQITSNMKRSINELSYIFLQNISKAKAKTIIGRMYDGFYDSRINDKSNRLRFLQQVKRDNRYEDLDKLTPEYNG